MSCRQTSWYTCHHREPQDRILHSIFQLFFHQCTILIRQYGMLSMLSSAKHLNTHAMNIYIWVAHWFITTYTFNPPRSRPQHNSHTRPLKMAGILCFLQHREVIQRQNNWGWKVEEWGRTNHPRNGFDVRTPNTGAWTPSCSRTGPIWCHEDVALKGIY